MKPGGSRFRASSGGFYDWIWNCTGYEPAVYAKYDVNGGDVTDIFAFYLSKETPLYRHADNTWEESDFISDEADTEARDGSEPKLYHPGTVEGAAQKTNLPYASRAISQEDAAAMETAALLEAALAYPYLAELYMNGSIADGAAYVSQEFLCLPELLSRVDAEAVLDAYLTEHTEASNADTISDVRTFHVYILRKPVTGALPDI
ncbi:MAG: hypothetical protein LIO55_05085 [Oscillospiraceae bacterium]|nr:hypothetical protein [Oscillospiraceae bacterium]